MLTCVQEIDFQGEIKDKLHYQLCVHGKGWIEEEKCCE